MIKTVKAKFQRLFLLRNVNKTKYFHKVANCVTDELSVATMQQHRFKAGHQSN